QVSEVSPKQKCGNGPGRFCDLEDEQFAARHQNTTILPKSFLEVSDMTKRITHGKKFKRLVRQRNLLSAGTDKASRQLGARDSQHAFAGIKARNFFRAAENLHGLNSHQPCPTGDIQQALARAQAVTFKHTAAIPRAS